MARRRMIIELEYSPQIAAQSSTAPGATFTAAADPRVPGLALDPTFAPVPLRALRSRPPSTDPSDLRPAVELDDAPESVTYIVRAELDEQDVNTIRARPGVAGVFSDPQIEPCIICPGSPPLGDDQDVESLLCASKLRKCGMDGSGVLVAIVDSGVNLAYLNSHGKHPTFNAGWSWAWTTGLTPGSMPVGHGTMCAFDVCIAAPKCTILDISLLRPLQPTPTGLGALLSDAVKAYSHLLDIMLLPRRIGEFRSMVVNNSWGMFHPSWDYPPGDPANYSDNPNHPFNIAVGSLEAAGADILFAAGNCGADCPDSRCQGVTDNAIYGANSHPQVLCVAGVDTTKQRVGYSAIGPGRLTKNKPDIAGYTHFVGSGVYTADGGTSAATPVVTGVVAAVRSKRPQNPADATTSPAAIRGLVTSTAEDLGALGYDFKHGHGVVDGCELGKTVCGALWWLFDICKAHPWICKGVFRWPEIPGPDPVIRWFDIPEIPFKVPRVVGRFGSRSDRPTETDEARIQQMIEEMAARSGVKDAVQLGYILGVWHAQRMGLGSSGAASESGGAPGLEASTGGECRCGKTN